MALYHGIFPLCATGQVKFEKRMYFLEKGRRYCRTYSNLEASLQKELTFFQQKAKEWAEVFPHTLVFIVLKRDSRSFYLLSFFQHEDFLLALQVNEDEYKKVGFFWFHLSSVEREVHLLIIPEDAF